ncbi:acetyl-CoA C-acyltransferase [Bosea sp. 117]|uniref:acetyl-CoA C-acyltransferase n=1 Tax=Bosea sp. 117 TaxID=1125973 RepID=UPI000494595B|nr:acetyl-CoA C-acyltransferase [Bosea sp. 117]
MSRRAFLIAARRTAVAPRGGAFARVDAHDLAAPVLRACLEDAGLTSDAPVDQVILGNALAAGGNVARLCSLAAGLPESVPALTVDTQCCAGLDAILLAVRLVESGAAEIVLAGGVESWSRAPLRARRPFAKDEAPAFYDVPPFTPWPERDPGMTEAVAWLAQERGITRERQGAFAVESHAKARAARERDAAEIVLLPEAPLEHDAFTRELTPALCARAPVLAGEGAFAIGAATVAVEADAAAVVLVASEAAALRLAPGRALEVRAAASAGAAPEQPALALSAAVRGLLARQDLDVAAFARVELMEAFAAQALANADELGLDMDTVNAGGGALARGHPIGASGAILAVRLFHELRALERGALGLAAIAAAGGLGAALVLRRN